MSDAIIVSSILGVCGLIITYAYNKKNTKLANHKMHKELFTEFNARYDKLNDDLEIICSKNMNIDDFNKLNSGYNNYKYTATIIDFFNLCAEEYYWYSKKRISKRVWKSWEKGMNDIYNKSEVIQALWDNECKNEGYISYYIDKKDTFFKLR